MKQSLFQQAPVIAKKALTLLKRAAESKKTLLALLAVILLVGAGHFLERRGEQPRESTGGHVHSGHDEDSGHEGHNMGTPVTAAPLPGEVAQAWSRVLREVELYCLVVSSDIEVEFEGETLNEEDALRRVQDAVQQYNDTPDKPDEAPKSVDLKDGVPCNEGD